MEGGGSRSCLGRGGTVRHICGLQTIIGFKGRLFSEFEEDRGDRKKIDQSKLSISNRKKLEAGAWIRASRRLRASRRFKITGGRL